MKRKAESKLAGEGDIVSKKRRRSEGEAAALAVDAKLEKNKKHKKDKKDAEAHEAEVTDPGKNEREKKAKAQVDTAAAATAATAAVEAIVESAKPKESKKNKKGKKTSKKSDDEQVPAPAPAAVREDSGGPPAEKTVKVEKERNAKKVKGKKGEEEEEEVVEAAAPVNKTANSAATASETEASKKSRKKGKKDKKSKKKSTPAPVPASTAEGVEMADGDEADKAEGDAAAEQDAKKVRFIAFVGNLPYTATADRVRAHFSSLKPSDVRLLTHREDPARSRGAAFVEFDNYSSMKTCLAKFHHTDFDDGVSPPRKINVELTAGGGGKTKSRKEKIAAKNQKLNEERARRVKADKESKTQTDDHSGIHPSRRAQMTMA